MKLLLLCVTIAGSAYVARDGFSIKNVGPVFPDTVCGVIPPTNYCKNRMEGMITNMCALRFSDRVYLLVMRIHGELTYYSVRSGGVSPVRTGFDLGTTTGVVKELGANMACKARHVVISHTTKEKRGYVFSVYRYDATEEGGERLRFTPFAHPLYERTDSEPGYGNLNANAHHSRVVGLVSDAKVPNTTIVLIGFGDLNNGAFAQDGGTHAGKLLMKTIDGGFVPFQTGYGDKEILCYGNRNMYMLAQLPPSVDRHRRYVWGENGNEYERAVFGNLFVQNCNLGWPDERNWLSLRDADTGSQMVLYSGGDNGGVYTAVFDGSERIFASVEKKRAVLVRCYMAGDVSSGSQDRFRSCTLETLENLNAQPQGFSVITPIVQTRSASVSSPMAVVIDPITGDIFIGDVFTGNIYKISVVDVSVLSAPTVNACSTAGEWAWGVLAPAWLWVCVSLLFVWACVATSAALFFSRRATSLETIDIARDATSREKPQTIIRRRM